MQVIRSIEELRKIRSDKNNVGFIPTMGSLHEGHLNLGNLELNKFIVREAQKRCNFIFVSIYVNPAQFSPTEDLDTYPRKIEEDIDKLNSLGIVDVLFLPTDKELYPNSITTNTSEQQGTFVKVEDKSNLLEGYFRPQFFRGVCTIVSKLINIILPDCLFLGQKDAQQCVILKTMINDLCYNIKVVVIETSRNENGLALSSRNDYLSTIELKIASSFYKALNEAKLLFKTGEHDSEILINKVRQNLEKDDIKIQYISMNHPITLKDIVKIDSQGAILSGAIFIGKIRLIDNILLDCSL